VATADLQPGQPVFRPIDKGGTIGPDRLTDRSISRIVKARIRKLAIAKGKTEREAETIAEAFSGHSRRAGYATTAGAHDEPAYRTSSARLPSWSRPEAAAICCAA
jgi:hypothetical protein